MFGGGVRGDSDRVVVAVTTTEQRRAGIGGSDIAAIVGLSPYKTSFDLWAEKTNQVSRPAPNKRMRMGKLLEQAIATGYIELSGNPENLTVVWDDQTRAHPEHPWMLATPDAHVHAIQRELSGLYPFPICGLDCKNVALDQAHRWGPAGTDEVPQEIVLQFQWYMEFENIDRWDAAMLLGGNDLRIYTVPRDKEIGAFLVDQGERWWKRHIIEGVQPEIGASEGARRFLRERFPRNVKNLRQATAEEITLIRAYSWASKTLKIAEEDHETAGNMLKLAIGDADGLTFDGGTITWRKDKDSIGTDWYAVAWFLQEQDRARLAAAHQIVTRQGPRKLLLKENKQ